MKTTKLLSLLLIVALAFASCKNNMSLTKRHYTKGYHFHKNKSVDQPEVKEGIACKASKKAEKVNPIEIVEVKPTAINAAKAESNSATVNNPLTASAAKTTAQSPKKQIKAENKSLNTTKHQLKSESKPAKQSANKVDGGDSGTLKLILCIILAIIICPLGMYIWNKKTDIWFIVDLVLFLLLFTYWFWSGGLVGLAAIVIALLRVFDII